MARMTVVQKQNTTFSRLLDIKIETLKRNLLYNVLETSRVQKQIENDLILGSITCRKCKIEISRKIHLRFKMDQKKHGPHVLHESGHMEADKYMYDKQQLYVEKVDCGNTQENGRTHQPEPSHATSHTNTTVTDHNRYLHTGKKNSHVGHSDKSASMDYKTTHVAQSHCSTHCHGQLEQFEKQRSPKLRRQNSAIMTDSGDATSSNNTNLTAFLFSRHCRHGYVMKTTTDPTKESNEYIKNKIRAKVVKNYLLQDVFKRLNTTKTIDFKNKVHERGAEPKSNLTSDTVQTLEQCRYLRVPQKKAVRGMGEDEGEEEKMTKVDIL